MIRKITEDTLVPLSFIIVFAGMVSWLTTMNNTGEANAAAIKAINSQQEEYVRTVTEVRDRLTRIETTLNLKQKGEIK